MSATTAMDWKRALHDLASLNGNTLTPDMVVEAARDPDSALHERFEWDDSTAAEEYRRLQAAKLIREVTVVVEHRPNRDVQVHTEAPLASHGRLQHARAFHAIGGAYRPLDVVLADAEYRRELKQAAYRELKAFRKKYALLSELADVFAAIDRVTTGAA